MILIFYFTCTLAFFFFMDPDSEKNPIRIRPKGPGSETLVLIHDEYFFFFGRNKFYLFRVLKLGSGTNADSYSDQIW